MSIALTMSQSTSSFRIFGAFLSQSAGLYVGRIRWDHFPDGRTFSALAAVVAIALYAVDNFFSGVDPAASRASILFIAANIAIALAIRYDLPWLAAGLGVQIVSLLGAVPLDGMAVLVRAQQSPLTSIAIGISYAWQAWFGVTISRLVLAKLRQVHRS